MLVPQKQARVLKYILKYIIYLSFMEFLVLKKCLIIRLQFVYYGVLHSPVGAWTAPHFLLTSPHPSSILALLWVGTGIQGSGIGDSGIAWDRCHIHLWCVLCAAALNPLAEFDRLRDGAEWLRIVFYCLFNISALLFRAVRAPPLPPFSPLWPPVHLSIQRIAGLALLLLFLAFSLFFMMLI